MGDCNFTYKNGVRTLRKSASNRNNNDLSVNSTNDRSSKEYRTIYENADAGQKKMLDRIKEKAPIGGRAVNKFGGSGQIQDMSFEMRSDGNIVVTTTAEAYHARIKSATIGVGDLPETIRSTTTKTLIVRGEGEGTRTWLLDHILRRRKEKRGNTVYGNIHKQISESKRLRQC